MGSRVMTRPSVVIHDLDLRRARRAFRPLETHPPLVVDANAPLALAIALQGFQPVSCEAGQVAGAGRRFQAADAHQRLLTDAVEPPDELTEPKLLGVLVLEAHDHGI